VEHRYCACGCGTKLRKGSHGWPTYVQGHNNRGKPSPRKVTPTGAAPLCACGCGHPVAWSKSRRKWNKYLRYHGRKGVTHTADAIARMSTAAQARASQVAESNRRRVWSEESRRKLSEARKAKMPPTAFSAGPDNPGYKHGRGYGNRPSAKTISQLREALIAQRSNKCELCGSMPTETLHVHHIDENVYNNKPANLQLLCPVCHTRVTHPTQARS
jgi:uncharacterized protein YlaI